MLDTWVQQYIGRLHSSDDDDDTTGGAQIEELPSEVAFREDGKHLCMYTCVLLCVCMHMCNILSVQNVNAVSAAALSTLHKRVNNV